VFHVLLESHPSSRRQALGWGTGAALLLHVAVVGVLLRQPARAQPPTSPILIDPIQGPSLLRSESSDPLDGVLVPSVLVPSGTEGQLPPLPHVAVPDVLGNALPVEFGASPSGTGSDPGPGPAIDGWSSLAAEPPVLLSAPPPSYPPDLRDARVEGTVVVRLVVDTLGRAEPETLRALRSDHPGLIAPAMRSLRLARFRPARMSGRAVPVLVEVPVQFRLRP
jgi:TonB family protein